MSESAGYTIEDVFGFVCPECLAEVRPSGTVLECSTCQLIYPIVDGIPVFAQSSESQYGTIAREDVSGIIRLCEEHGWEKGLAAFLESQPLAKADFLARYMFPEARAGGKLLLNLDTSARVLDLGCGSGTLTVNLARSVSEVIGVDAGLSQLRLVYLRAKEAGLCNLRLVCAGDRQHLPFPAESFDIVFLNGVLEWVGCNRPGNPRDLQRGFLADVHRVLKADGEIYIGIENRLGHPYLRGGRDEHTSMRFVTVVPRPIANLLSLWQTGKPYRVYTYSRMGYRKLLREAGFSISHFYLPRPNYRIISELVDGEPRSKLEGGFRIKNHLKGLQNHWVKARLYPYLAHSYVIIAAKAHLQPSLVEQAVEQLEGWLSRHGAKASKLKPARIRITGTSAAVITVMDEKGSSRFVMKIPFHPQSGKRLARQFETLQTLLERAPSFSSLRAVLPAPIVKLECQGQTVFVESLCPGFDLSLCYKSADNLQRIFRLGLEFLLNLYRDTNSRPSYRSATWESWLEERESSLDSIIHASYRDRWRKLIGSVRDYFQQAPPSLVWMHGDFWPGNLLVNEAGDRLTGVVDWAFSDSEGIPLIDLFHLLLYIKTFASGRAFSHLLAERLSARRFDDDEQPLIHEYCQELGVPERSIWPLGVMAWIDWVYRRNEIHGYLPSWRHREIADFLEMVGPVVGTSF